MCARCVSDAARVPLRDEHRRLVKLVEIWTTNINQNLLRARYAFQNAFLPRGLIEEMCSPAEYPAE